MARISAGFQLNPPPASRTVASKSAESPIEAGSRGTDTSPAVSAMGASTAGPSSLRSVSAACSGDMPPMATPSTDALTGTWFPATK